MTIFVLQLAVVWPALLLGLAHAGTYTGYTATGLIPFIEADDPGLAFGDNVHVRAHFSYPFLSGGYIPLYVDTGSCGIIISARDVPDWTGTPPDGVEEGWHYLSSSQILYNGYWMTKNIYFADTYDDPADTSPGPKLARYIRTRVPILVVTKKYKCNNYDILAAGPDCLGAPESTTNDPPGVHILGLGFGRAHDGQPQGTPDKNPLLHITIIQGRARTIPPSSTDNYWPGYIISKEGITVGLTDTNTASMIFAPLVPGGGTTPHWTDLSSVDWPELPACIKITPPRAPAGGPTPCEEGTALLDLGVGKGFIRVQPGGISLPRNEDTKLLNTGTHVQIRFGSPGVASAHFIVGMSLATDPRPVTPERVRAVYARPGEGGGAFINTSRYIYRRYIVAFDPILGRLGFKLTPV